MFCVDLINPLILENACLSNIIKVRISDLIVRIVYETNAMQSNNYNTMCKGLDFEGEHSEYNQNQAFCLPFLLLAPFIRRQKLERRDENESST